MENTTGLKLDVTVNTPTGHRMLQLRDEQPLKPQLRAFRALVFHHAVFFLLTRHCGGQPQMVSSSQPIVAVVGDDVMLPCHLEPATDASEMTVEWTRPDLEPRFVHVWRSGVELENKKHPSYVGRTSLSINRLKHGDISLTLPRVKLSDEGTYRCFIPTISRESTVKLVVGAVSSLNISLLRPENEEGTSAVVLECKSKGWYQSLRCVLWLSGIQQNKTNQTRDTHIHVPDDVFVTCHESNVHVLVIVAAGFLFIASIAVFIVVWKWRQNKSRRNKMKYFSETEPVQELEKKAEEPEGKVEVMEILMGQRNQQENLRDKLKSELKEVETEMTEKRKQLDNRNRWMLHRRDGWSFKPQLRAISALVFHHVVVFFLLTRHCGGQPQMVSSSQPIVAVVGDDVTLPCHLEPATDASEMTVEWTRPDLEPRFVHVWRS
ncbi:butyrophilin subfamily 3 member A2-like protein, partial [Lates japonicus]